MLSGSRKGWVGGVHDMTGKPSGDHREETDRAGEREGLEDYGPTGRMLQSVCFGLPMFSIGSHGDGIILSVETRHDEDMLTRTRQTKTTGMGHCHGCIPVGHTYTVL